MAALAGSLVAQVDQARLVATVNGEEIRGGEYYRRMEFLPNVGRQMGNSFATFPPGFLTIEQLITERLVVQLAKEKGIFPTEPEVQAEIRARLEDNPKVIEEWLSTGQSREEFEALARFQLAQFKLQTFGVTITDQEVDAHYKDNQGMFTIPKRVKLRVIAVNTPEAKSAVDADLAAGKAFADVAAARSIDITKSSNGEFGTVPITELSQEVRKVVEEAKIGKTTKWIQTGDVSAIFLLEGVLPAEVVPLDSKLRRRIRRDMMTQRGVIKNDLRKEMSTYRSKAKIDIKQKEFADAYARFIDAYLKERASKGG